LFFVPSEKRLSGFGKKNFSALYIVVAPDEKATDEPDSGQT